MLCMSEQKHWSWVYPSQMTFCDVMLCHSEQKHWSWVHPSQMTFCDVMLCHSEQKALVMGISFTAFSGGMLCHV